MKTTTISVRLDPDLKNDVESILSCLGITTTQAITMYFEQIKMHERLPFSVTPTNEDSLIPKPISNWPGGYFEGLAGRKC